MKNVLFSAVAAFALLVSFSSCNKGSNGTSMEAVVTVKEASGSCYFQLDDKTILKANNMTGNPFDSQTRAMMLYVDYGKDTEMSSAEFEVRKVDVAGITKILTKAPVESVGLDDPEKYGSDPIDIYNSWLTVVEDGYVTLHFRSRWGMTGKTHILNLVKNVNSEDPYMFDLRQDYNGDVPSGIYSNGVVAFYIGDLIADHSKTYTISIRHTGTDGVLRIAQFEYKFGTSAHLSTEAETASDASLDADIQ